MSKRATLLLFCIIVASMVIQVSLLPVFIRPSFKPDLLLVIMVFIALRGSFESGAPMAWILGLLNDICGGMYLGLNAATFLISFFAIRSVSDRLYAESAYLFVLTVVGVTIINFALNALLIALFTAFSGIVYSMAADLIPRLLINAFIAALVAALPGFDDQAASA
jgi:rod shape-determining protein MreD